MSTPKIWPYGAGTRVLPYCPFCDSNAGVIENDGGVTAYCRRCKERFEIQPVKEDEVTEQNAVQVVQSGNAISSELSVNEALARFDKIELLSKKLLKEGAKEGTGDFGLMPGTKTKVLFKAGAEKLCTVFRLGANYTIETLEREPDSDHVTYTVRCTLIHQATGMTVGSALGLCSSKESKYRYRSGSRVCPDCAAEAIIKGKKEYGGGWLCFKARGGCGAKWPDGAEVIEKQDTGKVENPDIADVENTVLKMAEKRAHVAATLNALGISSLFTQDIIQDRSDESTGEDVPDSRNLKPPPATSRGQVRASPPANAGGGSDSSDDAPFTANSVQVTLKSLQSAAALDGYRKQYWDDIKSALTPIEMEACETLFQSLKMKLAAKK